jgi:hypothetical protein
MSVEKLCEAWNTYRRNDRLAERGYLALCGMGHRSYHRMRFMSATPEEAGVWCPKCGGRAHLYELDPAGTPTGEEPRP